MQFKKGPKVSPVLDPEHQRKEENLEVDLGRPIKKEAEDLDLEVEIKKEEGKKGEVSRESVENHEIGKEVDQGINDVVGLEIGKEADQEVEKKAEGENEVLRESVKLIEVVQIWMMIQYQGR